MTNKTSDKYPTAGPPNEFKSLNELKADAAREIYERAEAALEDRIVIIISRSSFRLAEDGCYHNGMALRDWFAGMASESDACLPTRAEEVAEMLGLTWNEYCKDVCGNYRRALAICKYKYADAMLAERSKNDD